MAFSFCFGSRNDEVLLQVHIPSSYTLHRDLFVVDTQHPNSLVALGCHTSPPPPRLQRQHV